jgi:hypothetical protein
MMPTICSRCFAQIGTNLLKVFGVSDAETRNTAVKHIRTTDPTHATRKGRVSSWTTTGTH